MRVMNCGFGRLKVENGTSGIPCFKANNELFLLLDSCITAKGLMPWTVVFILSHTFYVETMT